MIRKYLFKKTHNEPGVPLDFVTMSEYYQSGIGFTTDSMIEGIPHSEHRIFASLAKGLPALDFKVWRQGKWEAYSWEKIEQTYLKEIKADTHVWNEFICGSDQGLKISEIPRMEWTLLGEDRSKEEKETKVRWLVERLFNLIKQDRSEPLFNAYAISLVSELVMLLRQHHPSEPPLQPKEMSQSYGSYVTPSKENDYSFVGSDFRVGELVNIFFEQRWTPACVQGIQGNNLELKFLDSSTVVECCLNKFLSKKIRKLETKSTGLSLEARARKRKQAAESTFPSKRQRQQPNPLRGVPVLPLESGTLTKTGSPSQIPSSLNLHSSAFTKEPPINFVSTVFYPPNYETKKPVGSSTVPVAFSRAEFLARMQA